ncbi:MAG: hypothetical protein METHP_02016 [Methanoregula sp. SKADARSKE-2]|nr:MAG: hypothetical protein METHP_02016 [Methanoregula sp. SKADARSKE-2]
MKGIVFMRKISVLWTQKFLSSFFSLFHYRVIGLGYYPARSQIPILHGMYLKGLFP